MEIFFLNEFKHCFALLLETKASQKNFWLVKLIFLHEFIVRKNINYKYVCIKYLIMSLTIIIAYKRYRDGFPIVS